LELRNQRVRSAEREQALVACSIWCCAWMGLATALLSASRKRRTPRPGPVLAVCLVDGADLIPYRHLDALACPCQKAQRFPNDSCVATVLPCRA